MGGPKRLLAGGPSEWTIRFRISLHSLTCLQHNYSKTEVTASCKYACEVMVSRISNRFFNVMEKAFLLHHNNSTAFIPGKWNKYLTARISTFFFLYSKVNCDDGEILFFLYFLNCEVFETSILKIGTHVLTHWELLQCCTVALSVSVQVVNAIAFAISLQTATCCSNTASRTVPTIHHLLLRISFIRLICCDSFMLSEVV